MTSDDPREPRTNRILVALDRSPPGQAALETAARLAAELGAELQGLFVEDVNLLRLASLPFAREIAYSSAVARPLDTDATHRAFRAAADEVQRAVARTAERQHVRWSFQVTRGPVVQATLAAAKEVDVLIIGRRGRAPGAALSTLPRQRPARRRTTVAVYDGTPAGRRGLDLATRLVRDHGGPLHILLVADEPQQVGQLREQCAEWLRQPGGPQRCRYSSVFLAPALITAARVQPADVLIVGRHCPLLDDTVIESLVDYLDYPVALVW